MTKKRLLTGCFVVLLLLWGVRVFMVNKRHTVAQTYYQMQEAFEWNGVLVTPAEAHLYSLTQFNEIMGVEAKIQNEYDYIICLKVNMENDTGKDIEWDRLIDGFGYGFETLAWCSSIDPWLGADLNVFHSETLQDGENQDIWFVTGISRSCFQKHRFKRLTDMDFYYVLSLYPEPVKIKLKME